MRHRPAGLCGLVGRRLCGSRGSRLSGSRLSRLPHARPARGRAVLRRRTFQRYQRRARPTRAGRSGLRAQRISRRHRRAPEGSKAVSDCRLHRLVSGGLACRIERFQRHCGGPLSRTQRTIALAAFRQGMAARSPRAPNHPARRRRAYPARALRRTAAARRRPHAGRLLPRRQRPGSCRGILPARLLSVPHWRRRHPRRRRSAGPQRYHGRIRRRFLA